MKKLKIYKDGQVYIEGGMLSITPNIKPVKEIDIEGMSDKEVNKLKKKYDKKLR